MHSLVAHLASPFSAVLGHLVARFAESYLHATLAGPTRRDIFTLSPGRVAVQGKM